MSELLRSRWLVVLGFVAGLVAVFLSGGAVRPDFPDLGVLAGVGGLGVVAALSWSSRPAARVSGLVVALAVLGWSVVLVQGDQASGTPGSSTAVLAVAAVIVVAAAVVGLSRATRSRWVVGGLGVLLVAGTVAAGVVAPGLPVRSTTAQRVEAKPLVDRPVGREWAWRPGEELVDVVAAGAGVVVATQGGTLTALDGASGTERWSYARPGGHVRALVATPDRSLVMAAFDPGGGRDTGSELLVTLDAMTGEPLHDALHDDWISDLDALAPTDGVLPVFHRAAEPEPNGIADHTVEALDLRTGEPRWTWSAPRGCISPFALPASGADVVLAPLHCGDRLGVVALDETDGKPRWERTARKSTSDEIAVDYYLDAAPDGSVLTVRVPAAGMDMRLDAAEGTDLATENAVDPQPCADRLADTTVAGTFVALCGTVTETRLTWQRGRVPPETTTVDWGNEPAPTSLVDSRQLLLLAAPGAIVVARTDAVLGFAGT
ncbi:MAG: PQQ-binding-like beta-propeller repeat protein [Actinophytocola sp.]|uniref:outer membrane protein assembly factor BamB family protein n=1 Tax=Actinophytocola sp. TaxID=1872138 RepID=UPI003D6BE49D